MRYYALNQEPRTSIEPSYRIWLPEPSPSYFLSSLVARICFLHNAGGHWSKQELQGQHCTLCVSVHSKSKYVAFSLGCNLSVTCIGISSSQCLPALPRRELQPLSTVLWTLLSTHSRHSIMPTAKRLPVAQTPGECVGWVVWALVSWYHWQEWAVPGRALEKEYWCSSRSPLSRDPGQVWTLLVSTLYWR